MHSTFSMLVSEQDELIKSTNFSLAGHIDALVQYYWLNLHPTQNPTQKWLCDNFLVVLAGGFGQI